MELGYILIGVIIGVIATLIGILRISAGDLLIDRSDPTEEPYLFLNLHKSVQFVMTKKFVLLKVVKENFIKQDTRN